MFGPEGHRGQGDGRAAGRKDAVDDRDGQFPGTAISAGPAFGIFALLGVLAIWVVLRHVPETSDKTLEAVEDEFRAQGEQVTGNPPVLWDVPEFHRPRHAPSGKL